MKSKFWLVFVGLLVLMVSVAVAYKFWVTMSQQTMTNTPPPVNTTGVNPLATFRNDQFGFQLQYAKELQPENTFQRFYVLSNNWRAETEPDSKGTPIVSIPVFRIDQGSIATGKSYPLYFSAEVRVGASSDPKDVADCLKNDPGFTEQKVTDVEINGIPFKRFEFADQAAMQYVAGLSYRTVHNNQCFAIEQLKAGSVYIDESMKPGYTEAELDTYFQKGDAIVKSFTFIK